MTAMILGLQSHSLHEFKPIKIIPAPSKHTYINREVQWLREEHHGWLKIAMIAYAALEILVLATISSGWMVFLAACREYKRQEAKEAYFRKAETAIPPPSNPIEVKSSTRSFNHIQEFAIEDEILWMRRRHSQEDWKAIFFDGFIDGLNPLSLDCDGANLIVLDESNAVHYKKIIKEIRQKDINDFNRDWLIEANVDVENDEYIAIDKGSRDNWKETWFTLPILHHFLNAFTQKRLYIPANAKAWAISHRGRYNDYLEDRLLRQHVTYIGVTTLYVLDQNGKDIYKFDPWSPKHVKICIPLPETSQLSFEAENIRVSASVIMAVGYEEQKANPGKRNLQIYTRLADIDSEGWNPYFKYDYFDSDDPDVQVMPLAQWVSHPLNFEEEDVVTKSITILQTGSGNNARELRIEGQRRGQNGFFFKKLDEEEWQFEATLESENEINEENILPLEVNHDEEFQTSVHDYYSEQATLSQIQSGVVSARLSNFGERSYHSELMIKVDTQEYELNLYRKKTLKNFFGFEGDSYELVIPEDLHKDPILIKVFQGKTVIPLQVHQDQNRMTLQDERSLLQIAFISEDE